MPPVVYNWSLGVQRDIGWNLVGDVAYVGNAARDQRINRQINGRPVRLRVSAVEPGFHERLGRPGPAASGRSAAPYQGYGGITQRKFTGYSDYHSMQFSVNRRRSSDGLSVGAAYTYPLVEQDLGAIDPFVSDNDARNYTQNGRRPHTLVINYSYEVPNLSHKWDNVFAKAIFDNWQISGITSLLSGHQAGFCTATPRADRRAERHRRDQRRRQPPDIVCDPNLPRGERTFDRAVQDGVHRAADRPVPSRHRARRRVPWTGLHELGHLGVQEHPDGRDAAVCSSASSLQRVQHGSVDRRQHGGALQLRDRCA